MKRVLMVALAGTMCLAAWGQRLDSRLGHEGDHVWRMCRAGEVSTDSRALSSAGFDDSSWMEAVVPGTVLTSLVENGVYPDPYHGTTNKLSEKRIPDITEVGREFYTFWFRTEFVTPPLEEGDRLWLCPEGINYRAEWWLNGHLVSVMAGMFAEDRIDITD